MSLIEITVLGIGLAMDAVAVSMTNGMVYRNLKPINYISMALFFGIFQGFMPLLGYYFGNVFAVIISRYSGIVIFVILSVIGSKMIYDGIRYKCGEDESGKKFTIVVLIFQALATSIDAFAVGIGFTAAKVSIIPATLIIACVTAVLVLFAIYLGKKFGDLLKNKAEIFGGLILVIIGIKTII